MTAFLSVEALRVSYGASEVLHGVDLDLGPSEFASVVGPSGCGKTTLLRTIAGLEPAQSGDIRLGGRILTTHGIHMAPDRRGIGWVPQDSALFPHLSVAENIAFGLARSARGVRREARSPRVAEMLELVNLSGYGNRRPAQLSGGQAQRVALARALAGSPSLVLLDEPFAGLDPTLRSQLRDDVRSILSSAQTPALLVTHDQAEALSISDRVAVMRDGVIEQYGSPREVYANPGTPWCARFLGETNELTGVVRGAAVETWLGMLPLSWRGAAPVVEGEIIRVVVRPESLGVRPGEALGVTAVNYMGHDALLTLRPGSPAAEEITARVDASRIPGPSERIDVDVTGPVLGYPLTS